MDLGYIGDLGLNRNNLFLEDVVRAGAAIHMQPPAGCEKTVKLRPYVLQIWIARAELQIEVNKVVNE